MLQLVDIKKDYVMADQQVHALKGVSLSFRENEFVSILGPSGCGKTTLLNIIGGLDRYTSGDLIIDGVSTKEYKDKDWDTYRNHSIGFVFQSYNLIPHQTVLENVELALTLSGISKEERRERATKVLEQVGLSDKLKSRPNQLSGGQMQRVAIARALVNDPDIILADEPTGALDTTSSVQIMEILKEISKERLIIMVTHNPELAKTYSTRIVKMIDGELISDSKPYDPKEPKHKDKESKGKKKSMSFFTALSLSFKNLLTKKARTTLVMFAGSIGIIGIALILAISSGFNTYVNKMQQDTLSNYPIIIQSKSVDFSSVIQNMFLSTNTSGNANHELDGVYPRENISNIINSVGDSSTTNNLAKFYEYLEAHKSELAPYINAITYSYNLDLTYGTENKVTVSASDTILQMIEQYAVLYVKHNSGVNYQKTENGYKLIASDEIVATDKFNDFFDNYSPDLDYVKNQLVTRADHTIELNELMIISLSFKVIGVNMTPSSMGSFGMTSREIFNEMIDNYTLLKSQYTLVGDNSKWATSGNEAMLVLDKNSELDDYVLYALGLLSEDQVDAILQGLINKYKHPLKLDVDSLVLGKEFTVLDNMDFYFDENGDLLLDGEGNPYSFETLKTSNPTKYKDCLNAAYERSTNKVTIVGVVRLKETSESGSMTSGIAYLNDFTNTMITYHNAQVNIVYDGRDELDINLIDTAVPSSIQIYVNKFESKADVKAFITKYNDQADKKDRITYTDYIDLIMSTVSTIITAITYVLIAFVSVSLIVSSIMIAVITYISVIERIKEIGVLRAIGASKRDVRHVFTAESFIIGLGAGLLGIGVSLLLTIPINIVLKHFTELSGLASLPWLGGIILVAISVVLTLVAGLIPARIAAKKDPVEALRTE